MNYQLDSSKGIIEVKNTAIIRKHNLIKSAEVKFYIKIKNCSDLKVDQCTNNFHTLLWDKVKILIRVSNSGPDIEPAARLVDIFTNYKTIDFLSASFTKGTYCYENGILIWEIGELKPGENTLGLITIKIKKLCIHKSIAIVCGSNKDPYLLNNFSIDLISPFLKCCEIEKLIHLIFYLLGLSINSQVDKNLEVNKIKAG